MDLKELPNTWPRSTERRGNRKERLEVIWGRPPHLNTTQNPAVGRQHTENTREAIFEKIMSENLPELLREHFSEPGSLPLNPHHLAKKKKKKEYKKGQEKLKTKQTKKADI